MRREEGWVSYEYRHKAERTAYAFHTDKKDNKPIRFITVLLPVDSIGKTQEIDAHFGSKEFSENSLDVKVTVGKQKYDLKYTL